MEGRLSVCVAERTQDDFGRHIDAKGDNVLTDASGDKESLLPDGIKTVPFLEAQ